MQCIYSRYNHAKSDSEKMADKEELVLVNFGCQPISEHGKFDAFSRELRMVVLFAVVLEFFVERRVSFANSSVEDFAEGGHGKACLEFSGGQRAVARG